MYRTLFDVAGIAMIGWALVIFLPTWRVTRRLAETAVFPVFLAILYLVGVGSVIATDGPGFMSDFSSANGVLGLLATESVALIVWIHILAFDQLVGVLIYRDNMRYRFLPIPVQSVVLFATLMLGPIGFLTYWVARMSRARGRAVAWGEPHVAPPDPARTEPLVPAPAVAAPRFADVVTGDGAVARVTGLLRQNISLVWLAAVGFAAAGTLTAVAAINGGWLFGPEGRLLEAVRFNVALGIYILTLALVLPLAPFTLRGRRRWVRWMVGLSLFSFGVETIQSLRGLDPRFSNIAGPIDLAIGGIFFGAAIAILVLFLILMRSFFQPGAIPDHPMLAIALRYGAAGSMMAFGVGIAMGALLNGRIVAGAGNLMPLHAAGFHGLQAVPLVALLLGTLSFRNGEGRTIVHLAGAGWIALCTGLLAQAVAGNPTLSITPELGLSAVGALAWLSALGYSLRARTRLQPAMA